MLPLEVKRGLFSANFRLFSRKRLAGLQDKACRWTNYTPSRANRGRVGGLRSHEPLWPCLTRVWRLVCIDLLATSEFVPPVIRRFRFSPAFPEKTPYLNLVELPNLITSSRAPAKVQLGFLRPLSSIGRCTQRACDPGRAK